MPEKIHSGTFELNKSHRFVGFEIEGFSEDFTKDDNIEPSLGEVVDDFSIRPDYGEVFEFRSRPANGDSLLDYINTVGEFLSSINADTNSSCGLHVHLDVSGESVIRKRRIRRWWLAFQPLLYKFVAPSRRGNGYCRYVLDHDYRSWYNDRGQSLNIQAIDRHGTYEVRIHHGTTDSNEITQWVLLMLSFFDTFSKIPLTKERLREIMDFSTEELTKFFWLQLDVPPNLNKYFTKKMVEYVEV